MTAHLQLQKTHNLERSLHTLPDPSMKAKWMQILKTDVKLDDAKLDEAHSSLKRSYAYLEWQDSVEHFVADKTLRNLILRACSKSNMSDVQAKRLQDMLFHDPILLKKYCQHIVKDKSVAVKKDPDFAIDKYPSLSKLIA